MPRALAELRDWARLAYQDAATKYGHDPLQAWRVAEARGYLHGIEAGIETLTEDKRKCNRYPERIIIECEKVLPGAPESIRQHLGRHCDHGHPSSFEGDSFFCGGQLTTGGE